MGAAAPAGTDRNSRELKVGVIRVDYKDKMQDMGKMLVVVGLLIAVVGGWLWSGRGFGWLGRLPGDISYQNGDSRFYFPVTTCVLVSVLLSLLAWLMRR